LPSSKSINGVCLPLVTNTRIRKGDIYPDQPGVITCRTGGLTSASGVRDLRRFGGPGERVRDLDRDGDLGMLVVGCLGIGGL
jgi:hypothetical protein